MDKNIPLRILICGDRNWKNKKIIYSSIKKIRNNMYNIECIIEGKAKGADIIGKEVAIFNKILFYEYPAEWIKYGIGAGMIRNQQMIDEGKPNLVLAFHNNIENSKGTKDMIQRAKKNNIETVLISEKNYIKGNKMKFKIIETREWEYYIDPDNEDDQNGYNVVGEDRDFSLNPLTEKEIIDIDTELLEETNEPEDLGAVLKEILYEIIRI